MTYDYECPECGSKKEATMSIRENLDVFCDSDKCKDKKIKMVRVIYGMRFAHSTWKDW
jgi:predicted nucleic acid-binding Zn ribbon protein